MNERCPSCKVEMKKGSKIDSGNTKFQEWVCPHCSKKITRALGANNWQENG